MCLCEQIMIIRIKMVLRVYLVQPGDFKMDEF